MDGVAGVTALKEESKIDPVYDEVYSVKDTKADCFLSKGKGGKVWFNMHQAKRKRDIMNNLSGEKRYVLVVMELIVTGVQ
jgi:hypothetical protein